MDGSDQLAIEISAGGEHTVVVTKSGTVYAWGLDAEGQVGLGALVSGADKQTSYLVPQQIASGDSTSTDDLYFRDALTVSAGNAHVTLLKKDGSVWSWGRNEEGQLGDFTNAQHNAAVQTGEKLGKDTFCY